MQLAVASRDKQHNSDFKKRNRNHLILQRMAFKSYLGVLYMLAASSFLMVSVTAVFVVYYLLLTN